MMLANFLLIFAACNRIIIVNGSLVLFYSAV